MNYITISHFSHLQEVLDADILITGNPQRQQEELAYNTWEISFDSNFIHQVTLQDLQQFMKTLVLTRTKQLQRKNLRVPVTFYVWFEEMSLQLCFDFLSGKNIKLPFGRELKILPGLDEVLTKFLTESQRIAIHGNLDMITFFEPGDPGWDEFNNLPDPEWIQDVYVTTLPQNTLKTFLKSILKN